MVAAAGVVELEVAGVFVVELVVFVVVVGDLCLVAR